jgi:hypothetical protein
MNKRQVILVMLLVVAVIAMLSTRLPEMTLAAVSITMGWGLGVLYGILGDPIIIHSRIEPGAKKTRRMIADEEHYDGLYTHGIEPTGYYDEFNR